MRNLAFAARCKFTVPRPASAGQGSGDRGPCAKFTSHIQVFHSICLLVVGWLVTLVLLLASRFVIFSVRVHVVRSAISAKRNNEKVPDAERRRIL